MAATIKDQSCAYAGPTGECRCKVRISLPVSRLLPGNWVFPGRILYLPKPHGSVSDSPTMLGTCRTTRAPQERTWWAHRFLHLPFGLIYTQHIFQKRVNDDHDHDHDANLKAVIEHSRETRHCFNADKCKIRCTEIPFFGHILSASSLRPDPQKVEAIISMDPSTSLAVLQTFLGMTQFFSCYVPNKASHSATLWDLTKGSSKFQW